MTCLFYFLVLVCIVAPAWFMWTFWRDAKLQKWNGTTESSRAMYTDVGKTLITASGIAVAFIAATSARVTDSIGKFSVRVGVVCLILCVAASLVTILALTRGNERARARNIDSGGRGDVGQLLDGELLSILISGAVSLASFLVALLFLARLTFHT